MTVTEASPDVVDAAVATPSAPPAAGVAALVGSGDPRTVGKLFVGTSLLFLLVSGAAGVLVGLERVDTSSVGVLTEGSVGQVYALHTITAVFLVVVPLLLGLATAVVPLQVGAATVAFPRASAAAYWVYLVSGGLVLAAFGLDGGPFGSDLDAVALFVVGFTALLVALTVATVSVVTTVLTLRAPGMSLRRTPLFSWSILTAGTVWVLTFPVLAGLMVLAYVDLRWGPQFLGGSGGLYDRVGWVLWQPTLYAFAAPALGIVADVVPVFAQRRHQRHATAMVLVGLFSALGFGAWAQLGASVDGSANPAPWLFEAPWVAVGFLAVVPVLGLLGLWTLTLGAGRPRVRGPLVCALVAGLLLVVGVGAGAVTVIKSAHLDGTTWMSAQAYAVLIGTLVAALGGIAFWAPKLYGRLLPDGLVGLSAVLVLLGTLAVAVPYALAGVLDQPRFPVDAAERVASADVDTVELLNLVAAIGGIVVVVGLLAFLAALLRPRTGDAPGDDPWAGHTLEWATSSPPPVGNFAELPEITSEAPVYDARHAATEVAR
ncbi:MAG TPA: cbb3-type cytochrome c oxidase subunit I [Acidimicrobiales bacterium]